MFRDLVAKSNCATFFKFDLKEAVRLIKENDGSARYSTSHTMEPSGFVFHESRCGSTLASNALAVMDSSHRVYSESLPPLRVLGACRIAGGNCPEGTEVALLRDVIYVMGRTNNGEEEKLFFKFQSITTKFIDSILKAFPSTPWVFIYRNPIEVMMSQFKYGLAAANCVNQFKDVPAGVEKILNNQGKKINTLSPEEKCAIHLVCVLLCNFVFSLRSH